MNPLSGNTPDYRVIADDQALATLIEQAQQLDWVAVDTEFVRTNTYYPQIGLIQLATEQGYFLIDPLALTDPSPITRLLANPSVVKVMHASSEDLEVFDRYLGQLPEPLYDTQIAAAILGYGFSLGYKPLVERLYQVNLPKGEQRSDWLARPLSQAQQDYAVLDVVFLADIYQQQKKALEKQGRLSWVEEECGNLLQKQRRQIAPDQQYLRVKGAGALNEEQLYLLQALAQWREVEAERRDRPRGFLLKDPVMVELAREQPTSMQALSGIENIHPKVLRKDGQQVLNIISQAANQGGALPVIDSKLPRSAKPLLKKVQAFIAAKAAAQNIPPELIINRKQLVSCLIEALETQQFALPDSLSNWKKALLGEGLTELVNDFIKGSL